MKTSRFPFFFSRLCSSLFLLAFLLAISVTPEKTWGRAQSSGKLTDLPKEITLEFNKGEKLAPKFLVGDVATPITTGLSLTDDLLEVVLSDQAWVLKNNTGFKYRASELRKEIKLKYTHTDGRQFESDKIAIKIKPNLELTVLLSKLGETKTLRPEDTVYLSEGEERKIDVSTMINGAAVAGKAESRHPNIVRSSGDKLIASGVQSDSEAQIDLKFDTLQTMPVAAFKIRALAKPDDIAFADLATRQLIEGDKLPNFKIQLKKGSNLLPLIKDLRDVKLDNDQPLLQAECIGEVVKVEALHWPREESPPTTKPANLTFTVVQGGLTPVSKPLTFTILRREGYITFSPPIVAPILPNGNITTTAQVRNKQGVPQPDVIVQFELENKEQDEKWVTLAAEGNQLTIYWRDPLPTEIESRNTDGTTVRHLRPPQIVVKVTAYLSNQPILAKLPVRLAAVSKFAPLKVKLNVMDERMASDLYGRVTSDENYVLTVRLFNNLKEDDGKQYIGSSILAYSASVEIAVGLEKKFNPKLKSELPFVWDPLAANDQAKLRKEKVKGIATAQSKSDLAKFDEYQKRINEAIAQLREAEKKALADEHELQNLLYEVKTDQTQDVKDKINVAERAARLSRVAANKAQDELSAIKLEIMRGTEARSTLYQLLAELSESGLPVDDGKWHLMRRDDFYHIANTFQSTQLPSRGLLTQSRNGNEPFCTGVVTYRPYTFEMMVNTVDRRDERSVRAIVFKILNAFGTAASLASAVPVGDAEPTGFQLFLDKYTNLLLPAADRLFPSLKETHRQNIVSQAMKPIEEIPFGSDITRVLFIPKRAIQGMLRGHETRISEICPFYFSIEVAVIQKGGVVQQGTISN